MGGKCARYTGDGKEEFVLARSGENGKREGEGGYGGRKTEWVSVDMRRLELLLRRAPRVRYVRPFLGSE